MTKYTRGEFPGFGAALAGAFGAGRVSGEQITSAQATAGVELDLILIGKTVYPKERT